MPMHTIRQMNEPVTRAAFERLPLLLRASEVKWATGWTDAELYDAVAEGQITAVRNPRRHRPGRNGRKTKKQKHKYTKLSVAKVLGFQI